MTEDGGVFPFHSMSGTHIFSSDVPSGWPLTLYSVTSLLVENEVEELLYEVFVSKHSHNAGTFTHFFNMNAKNVRPSSSWLVCSERQKGRICSNQLCGNTQS